MADHYSDIRDARDDAEERRQAEIAKLPTSGPYNVLGKWIGGAHGEHIATINEYYRGGQANRNRVNAHMLAASFSMHVALTPFADLDGEGDEDMPDDTPVTLKFGRTTIAVAFTLGDLRRARAAIAKAEGRA